MHTRALLIAALCGLVAAPAAFAQLTLRGDYAAARGITEVSALYARQQRTSVVVTPFSTNSGIGGVIKGEIDVAASARPPLPHRPEEQELVFWPVAWDAVVFIVHPSNPVSELSLAQVRDIFMGRLENWNEVGGRSAPIDLYSVMGPYDGLEASMRQILFGNPGYNAKIKRLFLNQHQIEVGIQMDPDAIGMTTLAGLNQQKVKPLRIEGVAADATTLGDGSYLLTVPLFLVYRADNPKAEEINRFAEFLRTPAAENVITGKRLALHREDEEFRAMHGRRLANLWEAIGGEPVPPNLVRFAGANGNGGATVPSASDDTEADAEAVEVSTSAASGSASAAAANSGSSAAGDAGAPSASGSETAAETRVAATVDADAGEAQTESGAGEPNGGDNGECRRRLFSRNKC